MHKELIVLGLLERGPQHGHELHRIVRAHGELYADLKKANLYHLLARLEGEGCLKVKAEPGTRGRRGERLVYAITAKGRKHFIALLKEVVQTYATAHSGVEVAAVFLGRLPAAEAEALLMERRRVVAEREAMLKRDFAGFDKRGPYMRISADHILSMNGAELAWIDRALETLKDSTPPTADSGGRH
ncbi:MAG: PadR family transcriptional regulator [Gammaproteobacteria bacterium]